MFIFSMKTVG